jgi:drug/metabolite transporter (DMT)-like permease
MLTYLLAILAACANATSSVLQRKANRQVPRKENLSLKLIGSLLHQPVWFGGVLAVTAGFLLQATALGTGQLTVVEPILVLELPATLILASRVFRSRLGRREWGAAAAMTAGLAGLLYFLSPSAGRSASVHWYAWLIGIGINLALVGAMVVWGRRGPAGRGGNGTENSAHQAAVLGIAAGSAFGLTAALMKGMTTTFTQGFGTLLVSWQLYGMIATGVLGMFLLQSAMNAGRLVAAQPGLSLSDPIISILWGVLVFGERVRGGLFILPEVISGLLLAAAVIALARSPLLSGAAAGADEGADEGQGSGQRRAGDEPPAARPRHQQPEPGEAAARGQQRAARGASRGGEH